jgi:hypothetical protein
MALANLQGGGGARQLKHANWVRFVIFTHRAKGACHCRPMTTGPLFFAGKASLIKHKFYFCFPRDAQPIHSVSGLFAAL